MQQTERIVESFIRMLDEIPNWIASIIIIAIAVVAGAVIHRLVYRLLKSTTKESGLLWRSLVGRTE